MRYLIKVRVHYNGKLGWTLDAGSEGIRTFQGTSESFARLLRRLQASDNNEDPRSYRSLPYAQMVQNIVTGKDNCVWVFSHMWPFMKKPLAVIQDK